jgi:hypothetical protein
MADEQFPSLKIHGPNGECFTVVLEKDRVTIGRFSEHNDIGLEPDPQQLITRRAHCWIERERDAYWVIDNNSANRTFIRRGDHDEIVNGKAPIRDGDVLRILGLLVDEGDSLYWELVFHDPLGTQHVFPESHTLYLEYDWFQARLFRVSGSHREEIRHLRPQEHKLIRYMIGRNRANDNEPVMCEHEELIDVIWEDEKLNHTKADINHLIHSLRQKVEIDPGEPEFLQSVSGLGYRLDTHPLE